MEGTMIKPQFSPKIEGTMIKPQFSPKMLKNLGVDLKEINRNVDTIDKLVELTPLMVVGQVINDFKVVTGVEPMILKKNTNLVMPLGTYMQLRKTTKDGKKVLKPYRHPFSTIFRRYRGQDLTNKRLLVWRSGGYGDLMFLQPILKHIKRLYPSCQITTASSNRFVGIYADFPQGLISGVLPVPFSVKFLHDNHYHLTFEGAIERCKEARILNVYDLLSKVSGFDIDFTDDYYKLELKPTEKIVEKLKYIMPDNFVVIQMRASSPIRMMSDHKWANIIKRIIDLGKKVVFIDGSDKKQYYTNFIERFQLDNNKVYNMCSLCENINHGIAIIAKSDGVVAIDSAFTHIGVALNKPVIGIYGSFKGWLRMNYYKNSDWVDASTKACNLQPCFFHQEEKLKCPAYKERKLPYCLETIDEDLVIEKFKKLILKEGD
jgi:ADP-heptose:LPS heptosyltransferase